MTTETKNDNGRGLHILSCLHAANGATPRLHRYAHQFADLLHGRLAWQPSPQARPPAPLHRYDLVLVNNADSLPPPSAAPNGAENRHQPPALLQVRQPRWPLQKVLLIIRGEATDRSTVEWGVLLARRAGCAVTLLLLMPPAYRRPAQMAARALKANTIPGRHVRHALNRFATNEINGVLKVSYCQPKRQLRREVTDASYDLIILSSEPPGRLLSWRLDSLLAPLTAWTERPLLVTGPTFPAGITALAAEGGSL